MADEIPAFIHSDGLASALFGAYCATLATEYADYGPTVPTWESEPEALRTVWRAFAARLQADGILTLLEVPEGHQPEPAILDPAVVGNPVVNLSHAVRVLAISLGFLRAPDGGLALCGQFVGNPKNEPEREVAAAWIMSREAVAGLLVQIIDAAGAVDPALALSLATAAVAAGQRQVDAQPGLVVPANRQQRRQAERRVNGS